MGKGHARNEDTYLNKDGVNEVSAEQLKDLLLIQNSEENIIASVQAKLQLPYTVLHTNTDPDSLNIAIQALSDGDVLEVNSSSVYNPISIPANKALVIRPTLGKCIHLTGTECIKLMNGARDTVIGGVSIENCTSPSVNERGAGISFGEHYAKVSNISFYNVSIDTVLAGSAVMLSYHWSVDGDDYATANTLSECSSIVRFISCCFYKANKDNTEGASLSLRGIIGSFIVNCHFRDDTLSMRQLQLQNCISSYVANNNIRNTATIGTNSEGIKLDELGTCTFRSTGYILNNTIKNAIEGIDIDDKVDALVIDNVCYECTEEGISIDDSATAVIARNLCYNCRFDANSAGIRVEAGAVVSMNQNNCVNNMINYRIQNGYVLPSGNGSSVDDIILKDSSKNLIYSGNIPASYNIHEALEKLYVNSHEQNSDKYLATMVTNVLYVDNKRTDVYTPTGSITKPFLTIQAANDTISGNSVTNRFIIKIATGNYYSDILTLNKDFTTLEGYGETVLSGAITITSPHIRFANLKIISAVTLSLANHFLLEVVDCAINTGVWNITASAPLGDEWFQISGDATIWKSNINATGITGVASIAGGYFEGTQTYTNCWVELMGFETWGTINLEADTEATIGAVLPIDAIVNLKTGATLNADSSFLGGITLNNTGGTLNLTTKASGVKNVPAGNISSTDVQAAINELDTEKTTINSGIVAPSSTPTKVGDIYVDTVAKKLYFAVGTGSSADWIIAN